MPTCDVCNNKWSWKQTIRKSLTLLDPAMICPYCENEQYQTRQSKVKNGVLTAMIVLITSLVEKLFDLSLVGTLSLLFILLAILFIISPFLMEVRSGE